MIKKSLSIVLILCLTLTTLTRPVMALSAYNPLTPATLHNIWTSGIEIAQQLRTGDLSALDAFLDSVESLPAPEVAFYASAIRTAIETQQADGGMEEFLQFAGNLFVLMGAVMIIGGIQLVITGIDISEGLISIILGILFFTFGMLLLSQVGEEADP
jgi:hypothetical protein